MKRGEVWLIRLDPTVGREIQKTRPCLIVSPDEMNGRAETLIIAPLTTGSRPARFRAQVRFKGKDGLVLPDQIRTVSRQRLVARLGVVEEQTLSRVLAVLTAMFEE